MLEPFVRLDTARRRDTVGFGLGLSIVARVVAAEGGELTLANRPEGGFAPKSVFRIVGHDLSRTRCTAAKRVRIS
ncbi:hypothetical protein GCM10020258_41660 [Sphingomonas yabuuchiae]